MRAVALLVALLVIVASFSALVQAPPQYKRLAVGYTDLSTLHSIASQHAAVVVKTIPEIKVAVLLAPAGEDLRAHVGKGLRYVEEDKIAVALELSSYSDVQWNMKMINATKVWDTYYPSLNGAALGKGVRVAVLDTGVLYTHPDLKGRVVWCVNTVLTKTYRGTDLSKCTDRNGHGTHVTGIIAALINNAGVAGVASNVSIYIIKVLNDAGSGTYTDIAEGIIEAVKGPDGVAGTSDDAKILSMSLGGSSDSSVLRDAVVWAYNNGAVLVAAAGNSGDGDPSTDNVAYPARYPEVIAVAAVDSSYNVPTWSSDGPEVDVAAPGVNILSTYLRNGYATLSGTSMATPHVSGVVALMQALRLAQGKPLLTPSQVYDVLTSTAVDINAKGFDVFTGYGLVDAIAAVNKALSLP